MQPRSEAHQHMAHAPAHCRLPHGYWPSVASTSSPLTSRHPAMLHCTAAEQSVAGGTDDYQVDSGPLTDQDLVERILQFVPQQQRLGSCALVNSVWRAAADAATTDISVSSYRTHEGCFSTWLQQRANKPAIHSIQLSGDCYRHAGERLVLPLLQLPSLQHLALDDVHWSATLDSPASGTRGPPSLTSTQPAAQPGQVLPPGAPTAPALTRLELRGAAVQPANLQLLPHLTALSELQLFPDHAMLITDPLFGAIAKALAQMRGITRLKLTLPSDPCEPPRGPPLSVLDSVSSLSNLRALELRGLVGRQPARSRMALLPASLTELLMENCRFVPPLARLRGLQHLRLDQVTLHSASGTEQLAAFSSLTNLRSLELNRVRRGVARTAAGSDADDGSSSDDSDSDSDSDNDSLSGDVLDPFPPSHDQLTCLSRQEAAALTTSPHLTALRLGGQITLSALVNMLAHAAAGGGLPNMRELSVVLSPTASDRSPDFAGACGCLVSSCPNLRALTLKLAQAEQPEPGAGNAVEDCPEQLQPSWLTGGLQHLAGLAGSLQTLNLYCDNHPRDFPVVLFQPEDWQALAALTSLTSLFVACSTPGVQAPDLMCFTACKLLQHLGLKVSDAGMAPGGPRHIDVGLWATPGAAPDVWKRLPLQLLEVSGLPGNAAATLTACLKAHLAAGADDATLSAAFAAVQHAMQQVVVDEKQQEEAALLQRLGVVRAGIAALQEQQQVLAGSVQAHAAAHPQLLQVGLISIVEGLPQAGRGRASTGSDSEGA